MKTKTFSVLLFSLLCVVALTPLHTVNAQCNPVQLSFDLCSTDIHCRQSMYIDENAESLVVFEFLYDKLFVSPARQLQVEAALCQVNNTEFNDLWTYTMSLYRYCTHINQYFDGGENACFCQANKICKYARPDNLEFNFSSFNIFMYAMFLYSVFITITFFMLYRPLVTLVKRLEKKANITE